MGSIISGSELFRMEFQGLTSGQPVNRVEIKEARLGVDSVKFHADGIVLLSGCDIGRGLAIDKIASIRAIQPNPITTDALVVYRSPVGTFPVLAITDLAGRTLVVNYLPEGTGAEQQIRIPINDLSSGLYRFELRERAIRSALPVLIIK
jgi:hypothetical protein